MFLPLLLACIIFLNPVFSVDAAEKVTLGKKEYAVDLNEATSVFLGNKTAVDLSAGEAVFLTYTVDSVEKIDESTGRIQHGVVVTQDCGEPYPYEGMGYLEYSWESVLLKPGYTYLLPLFLYF